MTDRVYNTKRRRSTKAEMEARFDALYQIVAEQRPMTVRQVFYQATVRGIIPKTENGYQRIASALGQMRRERMMPFSWLTDHTRWVRKPQTFRNVKHALSLTARFYRKALWDNSDAYVEVWLEKEALAGVVTPVTEEFDVPLMIAKGYPSLSFLHQAASEMADQGRPCFVYQFGDHDPSGVDAARATEEGLREFAPGAEIHFERVAVTLAQIIDWDLPSRPTKETDTRSKNWTGGDSVELDAIRPDDLRVLVRQVIEQHIDQRQLDVLKVAEKSERDILLQFAIDAA